MSARRAAGCMTGTSIDGLDAALVEIEGEGLGMSARLIRAVTRPLGDLAAPLRRLAEQEPMAAGEIARLARDLGLLHADVLRELLRGEAADLIAVHGQTVFHAPPVSWQMINAAPLAHAFGTPVVFDLRAADLAAGGQGAPITPLADWVLFRHGTEGRALVNLGGFCNVTVLGAGGNPGAIRGLDVCPCNHLLDTIARKLLRAPYDEDGRAAARGTVHAEALEDLSGVFRAGRRRGGAARSLGTGDEAAEWVSRWRARVSPEDLAATACEAIGQEVSEAVAGADRVLLAGGGALNKALSSAIASCCSARVEPTDTHGVPGAYREAACMAVLGALCQDRIAITLPGVTGVSGPAPIAGVWMHP